jgi:hypothetical protein
MKIDKPSAMKNILLGSIILLTIMVCIGSKAMAQTERIPGGGTSKIMAFSDPNRLNPALGFQEVERLTPEVEGSKYCPGQPPEVTPIKVFEIIPTLVDTEMAKGRGKDKISPEFLAAQALRAIESDRYEIPIGKTRTLFLLNRFFPTIAERIVRNA